MGGVRPAPEKKGKVVFMKEDLPVDSETEEIQETEKKITGKKISEVGPPKIVVCGHCLAELNVVTGDLVKPGKELLKSEPVTDAPVITEKGEEPETVIGPPLFDAAGHDDDGLMGPMLFEEEKEEKINGNTGN